MARTCPTCGWQTSSTSTSTTEPECPVCGADLPGAETAHAGEGARDDGGSLDVDGPTAGTSPARSTSDVPPSGGPDDRPPETVRNWAMAAHLSAFVLFLGVPVSVVGPLVIWLIRRETHPFIAEHAREAVNFNLTILIYVIVSLIAMLALVGFVLLPIVGIFWFVVTIIAAVRAANGEPYRYPLNIRFIS